MHNFHVGQKVVCIHDKTFPYQNLSKHRDVHGFNESNFLHGLTKGQVYTIRWVGEVTFPTVTYIGIKVEEIHRNCWENLSEEMVLMAKRYLHLPHGEDVPYHSERFAPLVKTDISVFTAMLNPVDQLEEVE